MGREVRGYPLNDSLRRGGRFTSFARFGLPYRRRLSLNCRWLLFQNSCSKVNRFFAHPNFLWPSGVAGHLIG
jgi:hypothetical protein